MKPTIHSGSLKGNGLRFAVVVSRWNDFLTSKLLDGTLEALETAQVSESDVEVFRVPGAFELPLTCLKAAQSGNFDAVIAIGVVIRGETSHYDLVAGEAAKGVAKVSLDTGIPVIFGVVTTENVEQAINRSGLKSGNKGYEAGLAAVELANLYSSMSDKTNKMAKSADQVLPHVV